MRRRLRRTGGVILLLQSFRRKEEGRRGPRCALCCNKAFRKPTLL